MNYGYKYQFLDPFVNQFPGPFLPFKPSTQTKTLSIKQNRSYGLFEALATVYNQGGV